MSKAIHNRASYVLLAYLGKMQIDISRAFHYHASNALLFRGMRTQIHLHMRRQKKTRLRVAMPREGTHYSSQVIFHIMSP